jgi:hypothetical protein
VSTFFSGSETKVMRRFSFSRNRISFSGGSGEMPMMSSPASASSPAAAVKSIACVVHPGVRAAG